MNAYPIPTTNAEQVFWREGLATVAGLDEAGRGPWAGPVCAAAIVLPRDPDRLALLEGVRDFPILMQYGEEDPLIPVDRVRETYLRVRAGYTEPEKLVMHTYPGVGHEVSPRMLAEALQWLRRYV